jgi:hypothetical protein
MATKLIKKAVKVEKVFNVGDKIKFGVEVSLQNIGRTVEMRDGMVVKVNRVTIDVEDNFGNIYRVDKMDIR